LSFYNAFSQCQYIFTIPQEGLNPLLVALDPVDVDEPVLKRTFLERPKWILLNTLSIFAQLLEKIQPFPSLLAGLLVYALSRAEGKENNLVFFPSVNKSPGLPLHRVWI
jgi:hypothetical protein